MVLSKVVVTILLTKVLLPISTALSFSESASVSCLQFDNEIKEIFEEQLLLGNRTVAGQYLELKQKCNEKKGTEKLRRYLAEDGSFSSQFTLGINNLTGKGEVDWLHLVAARGDLIAQNKIALFWLDNGKKSSEAVCYLARSAIQGNLNSVSKLLELSNTYKVKELAILMELLEIEMRLNQSLISSRISTIIPKERYIDLSEKLEKDKSKLFSLLKVYNLESTFYEILSEFSLVKSNPIQKIKYVGQCKNEELLPKKLGELLLFLKTKTQLKTKY